MKTAVTQSNTVPPSLNKPSTLIPSLFALFWAAFVLVFYFASIGPAFRYIPAVFNIDAFPPADWSQTLSVWEESLVILAVTAWIAVLTLAWGSRLRQWVGVEPTQAWIRWGTNFGFGVVFLNLLWMGTGLTGLWFRPLLWVLLVLLSFEVPLALFQSLKEKSIWFSVKELPREPGLGALAFCGVFYWLFSAAQGLVPEGFYDSMVYHLAVPSDWLLHHGITDFPTHFFSNYPYGGELFYLNGFFAQGSETAKMIHAVAYLFAALFAGGWAREIGGVRSAWIVFGLVLTFPLFSINIGTTQVEGLLALVLLLFLYHIFHWLGNDPENPRFALVAGIFLGLAFSIKYTAVLVLGGAFLAALLYYHQEWRTILKKPGLLFLAGFLLLSLPWAVKNASFTGNPFFPYFMSFFEGRHLTEQAYANLLAEQRGRIAEGWSLLILPWKAVMANPDGFNFAGPMALAFLPFLFLGSRRSPAVKFLLAVSLFFFVSGFFITHILRFLGTGFLLIYLLLGVGSEEQPGKGKILAWAGVFTAIFCFGYLAAISARYADCAGVWSGRQTRADYLMSRGKITPYFGMAQWVWANTPPGARLLIVGDARGLYYNRPFLSNTVFDEQVLAKTAKEEKDAEGIARRLKEMGVDYLVVNGMEGIRVSAEYHHYDLTPEEWKKLDDFIQKRTELVYQQTLQGVYRILPEPKAGPSPEMIDLVLFFSRPATDFVQYAHQRRWTEAEDSLDEALKLYPFSGFWKEQKSQFEKVMGAALKS